MSNSPTNLVARDLVCVLFPGIVKNEENAIQCMGGIRGMSQVYCQPSVKRLGLSFQPENPFIKKIYADYKKSPGLLVKVKVKKTKVNNEVKKEVVSTEILGRVQKMYKFESMCDFQYLPINVEGTSSTKPQCLLDQILPSGLDDFSFMSAPAPLFIVPSNFTRSDKPNNYCYTDKRYPERKGMRDLEDEEDLHTRTRVDRGVPSSRFTFTLVDEIPSSPHEICIKRKDGKASVMPSINEDFETVKKLFDERPIWSLNLLRYKTKIKGSILKFILPCLAIYMTNGPWRMLWVKYGYDPRKEPQSRIYQTLDFRLRHHAGLHCMVLTRDQVVHYKTADRVRHARRGQEATNTESISEGAVCFRPGLVPAQRQIFYQYCDVKLKEVEELLAVPPPAGYLCHLQRGWLPPTTDQVCRDHIFKYVKETLLSSHSADIRLEQESSDEEANVSEDDDSSTSSH